MQTLEAPERTQGNKNVEREDTLAAENVRGFLADLTRLGIQHQLGITGKPVLFLMEAGPSGDFERVYSLAPDGTLLFE